MKTTRLFLMFGAFVAFAFAGAQAQQSASELPRVNLTVSGGAKSQKVLLDGTPNLLLRERRITITTADTLENSGDLTVQISRLYNPNQVAIVGYTVEYYDANGKALPNTSSQSMYLPVPLPAGAVTRVAFPSPTLTAINSLQGDLAPTTAAANGAPSAVNIASTSAPNSITLGPNQSQQPIHFTARWSDQVYSPRSAGIQGQRTVVIKLLPDAAGTVYALGTSTATVILDDPIRVPPYIMNAIQDKQLARNVNDLVELETPGFRSDGKPNTVFYDDNYNVLTYTAESSDPTVVSVQVRQSEPSFGGRPALYYVAQSTAQIGASATIRVTANDGYGGTSTDDFKVTVVSSVTSVPVAPEEIGFVASPNPVAETLALQARAKTSGTVKITLSTLLGTEIVSFARNVTAGELFRQEINASALPAGVYMASINDGSVYSVQKIVKQ